MKISSTSFCASAFVALLAITASCSGGTQFAGAWQGNPERINVEGASDASATVTVDFSPNSDSKNAGIINLSAVIEVEQPVTGGAVDRAYQSSIAATASITGRYVTEDDDDDDLVVSFDPSTMVVNVDPSGVTFSQNILSGMQQPMLDSLTSVTAEHWRVALTPHIRDLFNRYHSIEDIKVHHQDIMSCEIADRDYTFRRVGVPD